MEITALASGSRGNAYFLAGESGALLIDAGLSARSLRAKMAAYNLDETLLNAILITHEHTDHIRGANALGRRLGIPVVGTAGTLAALNRMCTRTRTAELRRCIIGENLPVGEFDVEPFSTSHDAAEPCGFLIRAGDSRCTFCTDTGVVTAPAMTALRRADMAVLESNHCPEMLRYGPYPEFLKRRIRSEKGHLSNDHAATCIRDLADSLHSVMLAHLSEENNTPERALCTVRDALGLFPDAVDLMIAVQAPDDDDRRSISI
ncbi:MAG: MBL fold metallo-hydrolase [Methanoculleaceae archaeon]